jgi:hypothetical protein
MDNHNKGDEYNPNLLKNLTSKQDKTLNQYLWSRMYFLSFGFFIAGLILIFISWPDLLYVFVSIVMSITGLASTIYMSKFLNKHN